MSEPAAGALVVGLDEEGRGDVALERALELAARTGGAVRAVHAVRTPRARWWRRDEGAEAARVEHARRRVAERLEAVVARAGGEPGSVPLRAEAGSPADLLCDEARRARAALVLVGPHRERRAVDLGSATRGVLGESPAPVWMQVGPVRPVRRVLVPVDLAHEDDRLPDAAAGLARALGAHATLAHVFEGPAFVWGGPEDPAPGPTYAIDDLRADAERELRATAERLDRAGLPVEARLVEGHPVDAIRELAASFDLVVVGTRSWGAVSSALLGSTAYGVMRRADGPVVAIRVPG